MARQRRRRVRPGRRLQPVPELSAAAKARELLDVINPAGAQVKSFRMDATGVFVELATDVVMPQRTTNGYANGTTSRTDEPPEAFDVPHPNPGSWDPPSED